MPPNPRTLWWAPLLVGAALTAPRVASADPLTVAVVEHEDRAEVRVTGFTGEVTEPSQVITSRSGALLFLPGHDADIQRIYTKDAHRLKFVQVGRSGSRVALRIRQGERANGQLSRFMTQTVEDGTLVIAVRDQNKPTTATTPVTPPAEPAEDEAAREATLATLTASLSSPPSPSNASPQVEVLSESSDPARPTEQPQPSDNASAAVVTPDPFGADPPESATAGEQASSPPVRWLAGLGAMISLVGAALWLRGRKRTGQSPTALRIVSRVGVGPRQQILWVKAGDRELLVGSTEHGISLLTELDDAPRPVPAVAVTTRTGPTGTQEVPAMTPAAEHRVAEFKAKLRTALGRELTTTDDTGELPAHLRVLGRDPAWANREDVA